MPKTVVLFTFKNSVVAKTEKEKSVSILIVLCKFNCRKSCFFNKKYFSINTTKISNNFCI